MILSLVVIALLSACRNEFDFEEAYRANPVEEFKYNFETIFGKIAPDQSWDFSGYSNNQEGTISETRTATRATGDDEDDYVELIPGIDFGITENVSGTTVNTSIGRNQDLVEFSRNQGAARTAPMTSLGEQVVIYPITDHSNVNYSMYVQINDMDPVLVYSHDWSNINEVVFNNKAVACVQGSYAEVKDNKIYYYKNNQYANIIGTKKAWLTSNGMKIETSSKKTAGSKYVKVKLIDSDREFLYDVDQGKFLRVNIDSNNSQSLATVTDIDKASAFYLSEAKNISLACFATSGYKLFLGGYRLYANYWDPSQLQFSSSSGGAWANSVWQEETETLTDTDKKAINSKFVNQNGTVTSRADMKGIAIDAPKGASIKVYVQLENGTKIGLTGSSSNNTGAVRFQNAVKPIETPANKEIDYLGIDTDNNTKNYYNLVLAVVHNSTPIAKRYMVEDLGAVATSDIDFNDVVFDLKKTESVFGSETDLIIRAMGGTLDFGLNIGGTEILKKSDLKSYNTKAMYKTGMRNGKSSLLDYDGIIYQETLSNNPWIPEKNNVSITVYKDENTNITSDEDDVLIEKSGTYTIPFPGIGEAPCIIAFPVSKMWRDEGHSFCNDWLKDIEPALWEMPENAPDATNNTHTESFSNWISSHRSEYLNWVETKFSTKVKSSMETWLNQKYPVRQ